MSYKQRQQKTYSQPYGSQYNLPFDWNKLKQQVLSETKNAIEGMVPIDPTMIPETAISNPTAVLFFDKKSGKLYYLDHLGCAFQMENI